MSRLWIFHSLLLLHGVLTLAAPKGRVFDVPLPEWSPLETRDDGSSTDWSLSDQLDFIINQYASDTSETVIQARSPMNPDNGDNGHLIGTDIGGNTNGNGNGGILNDPGHLITPPPSVNSDDHHAQARLSERVKPLEIEANPEGMYYGRIWVGNNAQAQKFHAVFGTSNPAFYVPNFSCGESQGCFGAVKYQNDGDDLHQVASRDLGWAAGARGTLFLDAVKWANIVVEKLCIISMSRMQGLPRVAETPGIMGLALARKDYDPRDPASQTSFVQALQRNDDLKAPEFSFYFGRVASGTIKDSRVTFGGSDRRMREGPITTIPANAKGAWQIDLDDIDVGGNAIGPSTKGHAIIDTANPFVVVNLAVGQSIFRTVTKAFPIREARTQIGSLTRQLWAYPCATPPQVSFVLGGVQFKMNSLDMVATELRPNGQAIDKLGRVSGNFVDLPGSTSKPLEAIGQDPGTKYCISNIISIDFSRDQTGSSDEPLYLLGAAFLRNWYTTYNFAEGGATVSLSAAVGNQAETVVPATRTNRYRPGEGLDPIIEGSVEGDDNSSTVETS